MKNEEWYVILNMNCKYEICKKCPKSGLFKGSYEECEKWIEQKKKEEMKEVASAIAYQRTVGVDNRITDLEKENAKLERKLEQTEKDLADYQFNYPTIKELQKENAEAKEIVKEYMFCTKGLFEEVYPELIKKAEAFLKE